MDGELLLLLVVLPGFFAIRVRGTFRRGGEKSWQETAVAALGYDLPIFGGLLLVSRFMPDAFRIERLLTSSTTQPAEFYATWLGLALGVGLLVGIISGVISQTGGIHALLCALELSHETGKADIWDEVFTDPTNQERWARVIMKSGAIYVGWPRYFGSAEHPGLFLSRTEYGAVSRQETRNDNNEHAALSRYDIPGPGVFLPTPDEIVAVELFDGEA